METGLEHQAYVDTLLETWTVLPISMSVIEYKGAGDPFFGGGADDRPLGKNGSILSGYYSREDIAHFQTIQDAHEAALRIPNRRAGSLLGVAPRWR